MADYENYGEVMCPECGSPLLTKHADSPATFLTFEACPCCGYAVGTTDNVVKVPTDELWEQILDHHGASSRAELYKQLDEELTPEDAIIQVFKKNDKIIMEAGSAAIEDIYAGLATILDVVAAATGKTAAEIASAALNWYQPHVPLKVRTVNFVREDRRTCDTESDTFIVADSVDNPEQAIRAAVKEFVESDEGKEYIKKCFPCFSWGHALKGIPATLWEKYGLILCSTPNPDADVCVDREETLCDDDYAMKMTELMNLFYTNN